MVPRRQFLIGTSSFCFVLDTSAAIAQPVDFNVTIAREYSSDQCTSGYLAVNGTVIAYTLELPWQGNAPDISSIPAGSYGGVLRYDHSDHWRIELTGVPGRTGVEIHMGNSTDDSTGCILIGTGMGQDLCHLVGGTSKPAMDALRNAFYGTPDPISTPDKNIIVTVQDGGATTAKSRLSAN